MSQSHQPSELPEIDAVEIYPLNESDLFLKKTREFLEGRPHVRLDGPNALDVARLWRSLPYAAQMRCHIPPLAVRFRAGERIILEASVCWQCNNIIGRNEQGPTGAEFDGESEAAQELYRVLTAAMEPVIKRLPPPNRPDPEVIRARRAAEDAAKLERDRTFYDKLDSERPDLACQHPGCDRGAIQHSVLCRIHHFEMVMGYPVYFDV